MYVMTQFILAFITALHATIIAVGGVVVSFFAIKLFHDSNSLCSFYLNVERVYFCNLAFVLLPTGSFACVEQIYQPNLNAVSFLILFLAVNTCRKLSKKIIWTTQAELFWKAWNFLDFTWSEQEINLRDWFAK